MKFLNVGPLEFVFIVLLALIVLGPKRTIRLMGDAGNWIRRLVKSPIWKEIVIASKQIQDLPKKVMGDENVQSSLEEIEYFVSEVNAAATDSQPDVDAKIKNL